MGSVDVLIWFLGGWVVMVLRSWALLVKGAELPTRGAEYLCFLGLRRIIVNFSIFLYWVGLWG